MSRRFQLSLGTFFWPTVVVLAYVAIAVLGGLVSGPSEAPSGVELPQAPQALKRDLAIFSLISLAALFFGTWLVVLLVGRLRKR